MALLSDLTTEIVIPVCAFAGITYSLVQYWFLKSRDGNSTLKGMFPRIKKGVYEGVKSFLFTEFQRAGVFMVAFGILIFVFLGSVESFSTQSRPCQFNPSNTCKPALATAIFTAVSFLLGAFTSALSGFLGMKIAISISGGTAVEERNDVHRTFIAAFNSAAVMGFLLAGIGLLVLYLAIILFQLYYGNDWEGLFEAIAGYGLGGSSMALFGRAAGGIYAKAADVCVHLVKIIDPNIEQDYRNSAVIPNNVGDVVGDIAGMGTDLFGSYAESSCAALVVASISSFGIDHNFTAVCYALLISSMGIIVCLITTRFTARIEREEEIKPALQRQLLISTMLMTIGIGIVSWISLPSSFTIYNFGSQKVVKKWHLFSCVCVGLWARQISGVVLENCTNNAHGLVQNGAGSFGLAYVIIPIFTIAISIFLSSSYAATYGIAMAAIGMLSTIATGLAIDAYGPISHNAGGIAKTAGMSDGMSDNIRKRIDAFDTAGNTTAAIGKGFAIGSAVLVSVALFGAFVSRAEISSVDVLTLEVVIGLIVGAILPYWFTDMTMRVVGSAGLKMVQQVIPKIFLAREGHRIEPDYDTYVKILTDAAIRGMILPVALVMLTPIIVGTILGVETLSGVLAGSLFSVVWIAASAANTGGAWDKAKEYIKAGASAYERTVDRTTVDRKVVDELQIIAERGDAIGDQWKDTSGPPLNILIQLIAVESLVFAPFFATHGGLLFKIF